MNDRQKMKSLAIINCGLEYAKKSIETTSVDLTGVLSMMLHADFHMKLHAIKSTPAALFKKDKPEVDKRRAKRYHKNSKIVTVKEQKK